MTDARRQKLLLLMLDISEAHYCAGWISGLEYSLWSMVQGGPRDYGIGEVSEEEVSELRRLAEAVGGWWRWQDGECFTAMAEWLVMYEQRMKERTAFRVHLAAWDIP